MKQRKFVDVCSKPVGERHDDGKNHRGRADNGRTNQHGFCGCLESIARAVVGFEHVFRFLEIHVDIEIFFQFRLDVWHVLDQRKFVDRLRVVGDWTIGIHRDGHRAHAKKSERDKAERKYRRGNHQVRQAHAGRVLDARDEVTGGHQSHHCHAEVVAREITCHEAGQNAERCAAFLSGSDNFLHVARLR